MVHVATDDNTVIQYSSFFGVPTAQKYSSAPAEDGMTRYYIEIVFCLTGFWKLLSPVIKRYVSYWLGNTWIEDLGMKERRHKFLDLGFRDMRGLPNKVSERNVRLQKLNLPLPRAQGVVDDHPFSAKNIANLFDRP